MPKTDKRVDAYIAKAPEFARPILTELRAIAHEGCPELVETIKWSAPVFEHHGIMCGIAAFKEHCAFHFWKGGLVLAPEHLKQNEPRGQFGRILSMKDLPSRKVLVAYVKKAAELNRNGVKVARLKPKAEKKELVVPPYLTSALRKNAKAKATFEGFSYSHKKEYVEWITEAKTEETRQRRMATALEWLAEGKARNWKYEKC
jgi:uncharacterized protein YdeI (YjbR/CyaY-like superfamily)